MTTKIKRETTNPKNELRFPIKGKILSAATRARRNKIFLLPLSISSNPRKRGITPERKKAKALGSLNVALTWPSLTQKGVLPQLKSINLWIKPNPQEMIVAKAREIKRWGTTRFLFLINLNTITKNKNPPR